MARAPKAKTAATVEEKFPTKTGPVVAPVFLKKSNGTISDGSVNRTNVDLTTLRTESTAKGTIKKFIDESPDLSLASSSLARFAITDSYTVIAYNLEGKIDVPATIAAITLANRLDKLKPNYTGFNFPSDFRSLSESAIKCLNISGSFGSELVLGKGKTPERINIFSTRELKYEESGDKVRPYLAINGVNVYLDSPLIEITCLDQDPETAYSTSPFNAAIQPVLADLELANTLRRAFAKASLPRVAASIDQAKWVESLPADVRYDSVKLKAAADELVSNIQRELNGLQPEDALTVFDTVKVEHLSAGNISSHEAAKEQRAMVNARVSAGSRTLPSILGRGIASGNSSTESMLYLRTVEGGVQEKLNQNFSAQLTTGVRLLGHDCFVIFKYAPPSLRPKDELWSFEALKQSLFLEQLSLGIISDEECSLILTGSLPSGNYTPLSGTGFRANTAPETGNPYSNTSVSPDGVNDTAAGKSITPSDTKAKSNKTSGK